jgi:hypothetical protein
MRPSKFHIAVPVARIDARPVVMAACDRPTKGRTQVAHVELKTARLARMRWARLADGTWLDRGHFTDLKTEADVDVSEICRSCLRAEGVNVEELDAWPE